MNLKTAIPGFARANFIDAGGNHCSIQESSSAGEPRIWLGVDADLATGRICTRMHLNREQVAELLPLLQRFVETGDLLDQQST